MHTDHERIVLEFNERINARDLEGLAALIADDHTFIDSAQARIAGRDGCVLAWRSFFELFPDYRNVFATLTTSGDVVTVAGNSVCSDRRLHGPALWTAVVADGKVRQWRVYEDTAANRQRLGLAAAPAEPHAG